MKSRNVQFLLTDYLIHMVRVPSEPSKGTWGFLSGPCEGFGQGRGPETAGRAPPH